MTLIRDIRVDDVILAKRNGYEYMGKVISKGYMGGTSEHVAIVECTHWKSLRSSGWSLNTTPAEARVFPESDTTFKKYVYTGSSKELPDTYRGYKEA